MKKILSLTLAALMVVSMIPTAFAAEIPEVGKTTVTLVGSEESKGSYYEVEVPANMAPGDNADITVEGFWRSEETLKVTAPEKVTLYYGDQSIDVAIQFDGIEQAGNDQVDSTATANLKLADASVKFGTWSGQFNYNVEVAQDLLNPDDGSTPADYNVYTAGDYKYTYRTVKSGWEVALNTEVTDRKQTSYGPILESINGEPVTSLPNTFNGCTSLTTAPEIPAGVTTMMQTFIGCTNLTVAPEIPAGVTEMHCTFDGCANLTMAPEIPDSVTTMGGTFEDCTSLTVAPKIPAGVTWINCAFDGCTSLTGEISIPCSLASKNYTYRDCPATITYYHIDGCDSSCGQ